MFVCVLSPIMDIDDSDSNPFDEFSQLQDQAINVIIPSIIAAVQLYADPLYNKQPYHTSALSGHSWVLELLNGHPDRIRCELGVRHHVFNKLINKLRTLGHRDSRNVTLEEQAAIFLYTCVTGLTVRHVGERFQHGNTTISK